MCILYNQTATSWLDFDGLGLKHARASRGWQGASAAERDIHAARDACTLANGMQHCLRVARWSSTYELSVQHGARAFHKPGSCLSELLPIGRCTSQPRYITLREIGSLVPGFDSFADICRENELVHHLEETRLWASSKVFSRGGIWALRYM
jgi:hypothetical protein